MSDEKKESVGAIKKVEVTKVTSRATVDFPQLEWGIRAGEVRELPSDPKVQAQILSCEFISKIN